MKIGDLVRSVHSGEVLIISSPENSEGYLDVYNSRLNVYWHMPKEHLEVISEDR